MEKIKYLGDDLSGLDVDMKKINFFAQMILKEFLDNGYIAFIEFDITEMNTNTRS